MGNIITYTDFNLQQDANILFRNGYSLEYSEACLISKYKQSKGLELIKEICKNIF